MQEFSIFVSVARVATTDCTTRDNAVCGATADVGDAAIVGFERADDCWGRAQRSAHRRHDEAAGRDCYVDPEFGDTLHANDEFQSHGQNRR